MACWHALVADLASHYIGWCLKQPLAGLSQSSKSMLAPWESFIYSLLHLFLFLCAAIAHHGHNLSAHCPAQKTPLCLGKAKQSRCALRTPKAMNLNCKPPSRLPLLKKRRFPCSRLEGGSFEHENMLGLVCSRFGSESGLSHVTLIWQKTLRFALVCALHTSLSKFWWKTKHNLRLLPEQQ